VERWICPLPPHVSACSSLFFILLYSFFVWPHMSVRLNSGPHWSQVTWPFKATTWRANPAAGEAGQRRSGAAQRPGAAVARGGAAQGHAGPYLPSTAPYSPSSPSSFPPSSSCRTDRAEPIPFPGQIRPTPSIKFKSPPPPPPSPSALRSKNLPVVVHGLQGRIPDPPLPPPVRGSLPRR
jgi:hypothetical protein